MTRYSSRYTLNAQEKRARAADRLAADETAILAKQETDPDKLDEYYKHRWSHVRTAAISNLNTRPETVTLGAWDSWEWVRYAAVSNPNCLESGLLHAAKDRRNDNMILSRVGRHPNRTTAVMVALGGRHICETRIIVANDPLTPLPRVKQYFKSKDKRVAMSALANPIFPNAASKISSLDEERLSAFISFYTSGFYVGGSGDVTSDIPDDVMAVFEELAPTLTSGQAHTFARSVKSSGKLLDILSRSDRDSVRETVASNTVAWGSTLNRLCTDFSKVARTNAVKNPTCPEEGQIAAALMG